MDSIEAARLHEALLAANRRGKYRLVIEMNQLEYMLSAGFRALAAAHKNSARHNRGEVVLTQVPHTILEALDLVGFTSHFTIIDPASAAVEYAENSATPVSGPSTHPTD